MSQVLKQRQRQGCQLCGLGLHDQCLDPQCLDPQEFGCCCGGEPSRQMVVGEIPVPDKLTPQGGKKIIGDFVPPHYSDEPRKYFRRFQ